MCLFETDSTIRMDRTETLVVVELTVTVHLSRPSIDVDCLTVNMTAKVPSFY